MKKIILYIFILLLVICNNSYASRMYGCTSLTGGGTGAVDALDITATSSPNANNLADGDAALVVTTAGYIYFYLFDADATNAESSPTYIRPDDYSSAGVWVIATDYQMEDYVSSYYQTDLDPPSQAQAEDLTDTDEYVFTPQRGGQTAYQVLEDYFGFRSYLTAEASNEWVGMFPVFITGYSGGYDPLDLHTSESYDDPYVIACVATGSPWTVQLIAKITGGEWIWIFNKIELFTKTYASTTTISDDYLYNGHMNNYGQSSDSVLTLPAAAAGMNSILEVVDTSNALSLAPPSGATFLYVDSTGTIDTGFSANEKIVCTAGNMALGEELRITTYQTGASTYAYKIVQTIGDGFAEETP